jgi:NhaP-type Na+/H+ or K+/H+ antiporter
MTATPFQHTAVALAGGMVAQAVAARVGVPGIVTLLAAGVLLGPDLLGAVDPAAFGAARTDLVSLAVAVILFEGGLGLDLDRLRSQRRTLVLLLTLGAAVSMAAGTLAARLVLGMPWATAVLYGAIVIVTGPTVVTPLLARIAVTRRVRELLVSEGVLVDPIGAIIAIVAVEYVAGRQPMLASGWLVVERLGVGLLTGAAGGLVLAQLLRRRWIPDDLVNPAVLAGVLATTAAASRVSAEAGLMAAVAQGVVLGNAGLREMRRLREFKEALTVILLSFLFVVLAAGVRLADVRALGWPALGVIAVLVLVARPLAVVTAAAGSELTSRERAFVAAICPRGIVAAGVAGLFRLLLDDAGLPGGAALEALVFVTVAATVTVQGLAARPLAHLLRVDVPAPLGTVIVGADHLGRLLQRTLVDLGRQAVVVDRSPVLCRRARDEGLSAYEGDALSLDTLEDVGTRYADAVVAVTRNVELNALVAHLVHESFRVERVLAVTRDPDVARPPGPAEPFPGDFPGVDEANRLLRLGRLEVAEYGALSDEVVGRRLADLPYGSGEFALVVRRGDGVLIASGDVELARGDRLRCLKLPETPSTLVPLLDATPEPVAARA